MRSISAGRAWRCAFGALLSWALLQAAVPKPSFVAEVFFNTQGRLQRGAAEPQETKCLVPVYRGLSLVRPAPGGGLEPVLLASAPPTPEAEVAWLGRAGSGPLLALQQRMSAERTELPGFWLLDFSSCAEVPDAAALKAEGGQWCKLRSRSGPSVIDDLAADDYAALLSTAAGLSEWHRSMPFCAKCGGRTVSFRSGLNRRCEDCHARYRPRLDPSVIVLVTHRERCLLGRKAQWPEGRFSTLAGFVEFGETFEECVVREVREESGVTVDPCSLRFVASQPWLFPRSLMVGFIAEASDPTITLDADELQDVAWFDCAAVREALNGNETCLNVPSRASLANSLMRTWLREAEE